MLRAFCSFSCICLFIYSQLYWELAPCIASWARAIVCTASENYFFHWTRLGLERGTAWGGSVWTLRLTQSRPARAAVSPFLTHSAASRRPPPGSGLRIPPQAAIWEPMWAGNSCMVVLSPALVIHIPMPPSPTYTASIFNFLNMKFTLEGLTPVSSWKLIFFPLLTHFKV